ncbi:hypothetical protein WJX72_007076 [[Myrmecia] bisecta]|uniref:Thioredoxin-dependent peroxiredoxin Q n=1 Tax=[Myrmecia] bisecta TaxID=41462 RepID=A0AAW1P5G3_9CHLO
MTGKPGVPLPEGWDHIPGARGCTPQACSFRDSFQELQRLGVRCVFGLSAQSTADQREVVQRLHLPYELLSDAKGDLVRLLQLPTFEVAGVGQLIKRLTLVAKEGKIVRCFYPIFPSNKNVDAVKAWLESSTSHSRRRAGGRQEFEPLVWALGTCACIPEGALPRRQLARLGRLIQPAKGPWPAAPMR